MVKVVENKKLLYGDREWRYWGWKDVNGIPNMMQTIQFIRSHCPELIEGSKCEHLQYSLNVVAILPRHASSFYKGGLRRILHRVHRRIGGPHPRFNLTVEKNPVHPEPVELSKFYFFVPVLNQVLTIGQDIFSIKAKKLKTTTSTISL